MTDQDKHFIEKKNKQKKKKNAFDASNRCSPSSQKICETQSSKLPFQKEKKMKNKLNWNKSWPECETESSVRLYSMNKNKSIFSSFEYDFNLKTVLVCSALTAKLYNRILFFLFFFFFKTTTTTNEKKKESRNIATTKT